MPLVSIIMNVRNGASFLQEALDSVMTQTFKDWELIVWDDRSTDDSAKIVAEYQDARIRYFLSPDDTPLGKARDRAMSLGDGAWLAFLDQDDVWLAHKLEQQTALVAPGVGLIYGRTVIFDSSGRSRDYDYTHEFQLLPEGNIFAQLFADGCFIAMSSAMLRRSAVEEVGGIPDSIEVIPDYYLYVAIAHRYRARAVQPVVCRYRWHSGSMSRGSRERLHAEPLLLIEQWAESLDPRIVAYRRMTYSSVLAWEEIRSLRSAGRGLMRLFTKGSLIWLLSRPFVRAWRTIRRTVRRPYWLSRDATNQRGHLSA